MDSDILGKYHHTGEDHDITHLVVHPPSGQEYRVSYHHRSGDISIGNYEIEAIAWFIDRGRWVKVSEDAPVLPAHLHVSKGL